MKTTSRVLLALSIMVLSVLSCYIQGAPTTPGNEAAGAGSSNLRTFAPRQHPSAEVTAMKALNVRQHPGENEIILTTLLSGSVVEVTGACTETGWVKISFDNAFGWVNADYLSGDICDE